jgi:hypothetical protein
MDLFLSHRKEHELLFRVRRCPSGTPSVSFLSARVFLEERADYGACPDFAQPELGPRLNSTPATRELFSGRLIGVRP